MRDRVLGVPLAFTRICPTAFLVPIAIAIATLAPTTWAKDAPSPRLPFSATFMDSLMRNRAFAARAQALSPPARRRLAMTLAVRGVRRLGDEALASRAAYLGRLLERLDDSLCVKVAVGMPLSSAQWDRVIDAMTELERAGIETEPWYRTQTEAVVAELTGAPAPEADVREGGLAMHALRELLTDGERARFDAAWGERPSIADFAAALRMAYHHAPGLTPEARSALLRLLVAS